MHFLGERVLFDDRLLRAGIQYQLDDIIEEARSSAEFMPLTPEIIEEVLSESASVRYGGRMSWASQPLRPLVLRHLCTFQFCTEVDFMDYVGCFENDGAFAAEIMEFMKSEIEWAVKRWEADVEQPVDAAEKEQQFADEEGVAQWVATRPRALQGVGLVLRYFCTFAGCTKTDFRAYSQCFELDGEFAAEILNYMVEELLWIVEMWEGREGGRWMSRRKRKRKKGLRRKRVIFNTWWTELCDGMDGVEEAREWPEDHGSVGTLRTSWRGSIACLYSSCRINTSHLMLFCCTTLLILTIQSQS